MLRVIRRVSRGRVPGGPVVTLLISAGIPVIATSLSAVVDPTSKVSPFVSTGVIRNSNSSCGRKGTLPTGVRSGRVTIRRRAEEFEAG